MCMHTRMTASCSTQQGSIVLKQIKVDMPCYRVTGEEGTPVYLTVASYFGEQNIFLYTHSMAFPAFKSLQPSSNTSVTFSSSSLSSNPAVCHLCHSFHQHFALCYQPITPQHKVLDLLHFPSSHIDHRSCLLFSVQSIYQSQPSTQLCHLSTLP